MKVKLAVLAAATVAVVAVGVAPAGAASSYGPGQYKTGPKNADPSVIVAEADPATGKVTILQRNTRQAAAVNCVGDGPRATLLAVHAVTDPVTSSDGAGACCAGAAFSAEAGPARPRAPRPITVTRMPMDRFVIAVTRPSLR